MGQNDLQTVAPVSLIVGGGQEKIIGGDKKLNKKKMHAKRTKTLYWNCQIG